MSRIATVSLTAALACFAAFFTNVAFGAAKRPVFLSDVMEMALLLAAAALFVVGVLARESAAKNNNHK